MSTYTKLAAAAVVVLAAGGFALWQLAPPPGPGTTVPPTATVAPTAPPTTAPTDRPEPTTYVPGALTQTFTSDVHGISLNYPEAWAAKAATEPWTDGVLPHFGEPATDVVFDVKLEDHLFVGVGSQPLGDIPPAEWQSDFLDSEGCGARDAIVVDGVDGIIGRDCDIAIVQVDGRGYIIGLWSSSDDPELLELDTRALFQDVLATVQFHPEDAVE